jgi:hypothetical protein
LPLSIEIKRVWRERMVSGGPGEEIRENMELVGLSLDAY